MDYKIILGYLATSLAIISAIPYFWGIYKGHIKPHAFTWLAWGALAGAEFVVLLVEGGGAGSWIMLFNCIAFFAIAIIGFIQRHVKYILFDWLALIGAFLAMGLWWLTSNPLLAVILIILSDAIALLPTIRKAYFFPNEESVFPWAIGILYYIIGITALESFTVTTWLYQVCIIILDAIFVIEVLIRRRQLKL